MPYGRKGYLSIIGIEWVNAELQTVSTLSLLLQKKDEDRIHGKIILTSNELLKK